MSDLNNNILAAYRLGIVQDNLMRNQIMAAFISQGMTSHEAFLATDRHYGINRNSASYKAKAAVSNVTSLIFKALALCFVLFFVAGIGFAIFGPEEHLSVGDPLTPGCNVYNNLPC